MVISTIALAIGRSQFSISFPARGGDGANPRDHPRILDKDLEQIISNFSLQIIMNMI